MLNWAPFKRKYQFVEFESELRVAPEKTVINIVDRMNLSSASLTPRHAE